MLKYSFTLLSLALYVFSEDIPCDNVYFCTDTAASLRNQLLRRTAYLITQIEGEVKYLRVFNNTNQTQALEENLENLIEFELELRISDIKNVTDSTMRGMDERLNNLEERFRSQLNSIARQFESRRDILKLINRTQDLINVANDTARALRTAKRDNNSISTLETQAKILQDVLRGIQMTQNAQQITRLEATLVESGLIVWQTINSLNGIKVKRVNSVKKRSYKDEVIRQADSLLAVVNSTIPTLMMQNRTQAVKLLQRHEELLLQSLKQLNSTNNETMTAQIDSYVDFYEVELMEDMRRLGKPIDINERRDLIVIYNEELQRFVSVEIENLRKANKTSSALNVESFERRVAESLTKMWTLNQSKDILAMEQTLQEIERNVSQELKKADHPVITREVRDELEKRVEDLAIYLLIEVRKLRDEGRISSADGLRKEERHQIHLDAEIKVAVSPSEIERLEARLKEEEGHIEEEIKELIGNSTKNGFL